jgi:beta-lactamase superfamily II metal-dependent hydrolase
MMDIIIFNVEMGQSIFFYPRNYTTYGLMVDCGNTPKFEPIDKLLEWNLLPEKTNSGPSKQILKNLTITNYDQDHFSGLPYLRNKVMIETTRLPKNISSDEVRKLKDKITKPIEEIIKLKDEYTNTVILDTPYNKDTFFLKQSDFPGEEIDTNKLSQIVFVTYKGTCICIPGDLTSPAWEKHLANNKVQEKLGGTRIFVASHHGREDGFNEGVFNYCRPEVIILSDKDIVHKTQQGHTQTYASEVEGNGIIFNGSQASPRKILTTRSDGHLWIRIEENGDRTYKSVKV